MAVSELQSSFPPTAVEAPEDLHRRVISLAIAIAIVVGLLLFVALRAHNSYPVVKVTGTATVGHPAPDFAVTDLAGHQFSLSSLRGHPVILAFGASWCGPCFEEYPLLVRAEAKYAGRLVVVSVMYEDLRADELRFLKGQGVHWTAIDDNTNALAAAYQVHGLPETFFVTPGGELAERGFGLTSQRALDGPLNRLLAAP